MKSVVLKYGSISGALMAILLFTSIPLAPRLGFNTVGMILFLGKIAVYIPIYYGIRYFRQNNSDGNLTFWKGFNIGILIVVIACVFYALSWIMLYYWVAPDFPDRYFADYIAQLKLHGALPKDITDAQTQFEESKKVLVNPLINAAYAFTDPLETGIIMTLIFTVILRKKPPTVELGNLN
ncbi:MAG TPA: DUF4199 domain-containing protein [Bacteroidia bacterium]|nr:DUF4199 domain-containing protein [Bacteroidia bacterium]